MTGQQEADAMLQAHWTARDRRRQVERRAHLKAFAPLSYAELTAALVKRGSGFIPFCLS